MPNSMVEGSDTECGGDEEGRAEGIRTRDVSGDDDCKGYSDWDSTVGLNGEEEGRLPPRFEVDHRNQTNGFRGSSSEAVFGKKRGENGDFGNLGPDTKDTELRLGLPKAQDEVSGSKPGVRLTDPVCFDGISQGGRIKQNELNGFVPRCSLDSQARGYSIQGKEEFKLKPMFSEFTMPDLSFDARRFSLTRPSFEIKNGLASLSGTKRIFSETLESSRASGSGELKCPFTNSSPQLYMPPPLFNFPFAGRPPFGQFSGHMGPNEGKLNEAGEFPHAANQKGSPVDSQTPRNQTGIASEQRAPVGWPPVRPYRRNLAPQPKLGPVAQPNAVPVAPPPPVLPLPPPPPVVALPPPMENEPATMFVKVNVEGIPFGRKIDLSAHDSYDKLVLALDDMFRDSIAVQNSSISSSKPPSLSNGDYVLVYEDDEGDRMLVGDVPWRLFVTAVKRLRIMRSSEAGGLGRVSSSKTKAGTA